MRKITTKTALSLIPGLAIFAASAASASGHTQLELATVDNKTVTCQVSETDSAEAPLYKATLTVKGMSLAPAVMNPQTGEWMDISKEPLFVFAPNHGSSDAKANVPVSVYTKMFVKPEVTNLYLGSSAIGRPLDVPFEASINLSYALRSENPTPFSRTIMVNGSKACVISFDTASAKFK